MFFVFASAFSLSSLGLFLDARECSEHATLRPHQSTEESLFLDLAHLGNLGKIKINQKKHPLKGQDYVSFLGGKKRSLLRSYFSQQTQPPQTSNAFNPYRLAITSKFTSACGHLKGRTLRVAAVTGPDFFILVHFLMPTIA